MSQRRGTTTNRLSNVMQVIQLGRKTGILTAERGEGATLEAGEITFVRGQVTHAHCGPLYGQLALNLLNSWEACRFLFVYYGAESVTGSLPALPPPKGTPEYGTNTYPQPGSSSLPGEDLARGHVTRQLQPAHNGAYSRPYRITQPAEALRLMEQARASRLHRHIFLLIDGQRTIAELVRLIGRRQDEIQQLLYDLENIGIIRQS
jgi:hypothetical protein